MASVARYCCCGVDPCAPCGSSGSSPNSASIAGVGAGCGTLIANPVPFFSFSSGAVCEWLWGASLGGPGTQSTNVRLFFGTGTVFSTNANCTPLPISNEWAIEVYHIRQPGAITEYYQDLEKTTGFSCDPSTGRVSGTHAFALPTCGGLVTSGCLSTAATVTVPA